MREAYSESTFARSQRGSESRIRNHLFFAKFESFGERTAGAATERNEGASAAAVVISKSWNSYIASTRFKLFNSTAPHELNGGPGRKIGLAIHDWSAGFCQWTGELFGHSTEPSRQFHTYLGMKRKTTILPASKDSLLDYI